MCRSAAVLIYELRHISAFYFMRIIVICVKIVMEMVKFSEEVTSFTHFSAESLLIGQSQCVAFRLIRRAGKISHLLKTDFLLVLKGWSLA
jgi:hypothetical protein